MLAGLGGWAGTTPEGRRDSWKFLLTGLQVVLASERDSIVR